MAVTTVTGLLQPQNNGANLAAVKAWGSSISSLFSGAGLVQTSDTGQVNWTTTTYTPRTTSGTSTIGYEVWRFSDSLQSTSPIFLIVTYLQGWNTSTNQAYLVSLQVCTSTNGGGTAVTGGTTANLLQISTASVALVTAGGVAGWSGPINAFSSGDGSYLVLVFGNSSSATGFANGGGLGTFYIDRTHDASGAITAEGYMLAVTGWNGNYNENTASAVYLGYSASLGTFNQVGSGAASSTGYMLPGYIVESMSVGTTLGFDAPVQVANQKLLPPILAAVGYWSADAAQGTVVTMTLSGSTHTYYLLGAFATLADRLPGNTSAALAVRYE